MLVNMKEFAVFILLIFPSATLLNGAIVIKYKYKFTPLNTFSKLKVCATTREIYLLSTRFRAFSYSMKMNSIKNVLIDIVIVKGSLQ